MSKKKRRRQEKKREEKYKKYHIVCSNMDKYWVYREQRKFKLVKRRELSPSVSLCNSFTP